jgi:cytochrome bd-type quinol oxidase subunit 1
MALSKVTFAVGAVTGTVLSFEFGLLWPQFMGKWGEAFGVPFAFEGLFFFTEAIFILMGAACAPTISSLLRIHAVPETVKLAGSRYRRRCPG